MQAGLGLGSRTFRLCGFGLSLEEVHTGVQEEGEEGTCRAPGDMGDPEPGPGVDRADLTSPLKSLRCLPGPWLKL